MKDLRGYEVIEMNVQLVYAVAFLLNGIAFVIGNNRWVSILMIVAALAYGLATGWWAYGKYHGVF